MPPEEEVVHFSFAVPSRDASGWRVRALHLVEALSEPYVGEVDLLATQHDVDLMAVVGESATLEIIRGEHVQKIKGIVVRVDHTGNNYSDTFGVVRIVPAFALLSQRMTSRIFQSKTVPEILEAVLTEGLTPFQRKLRLDLKGTYTAREYCLQHEETDRDFVERLMQEEGIWYAFDHEGESETLVLRDRNPTFVGLTDGPLTILSSLAAGSPQHGLRHFSLGTELRPNASLVRGYDWTHPDLPAKGEGKVTTQKGPRREIFRHASDVLLGSYEGEKYKTNTAGARARVRAESYEAQVAQARGAGYTVGFTAGAMFELAEHVVETTNGSYLLTRVEHRAEPNLEENDDQVAPSYENHFTCLRHDTPFRPARTIARPKIGGLQSAIVTGPAGEEIHVDSHGRIKVRFPWDRLALNDETSSCWVRVAQTWAGAGWGALFTPRIGMEVLVAFFDGDPDRPIVVGCTYNGAHPPPYELPGNKTQSGIKTQSSTGGNGNNEIRFEDAAGNEELYFQAQKDHKILVKNDKTQEVWHDETLHVKHDRTKTVDGNQTLTVHGNDTSTIDQNQSVKVMKDQETVVLCNRSVAVSLTQTTDVGLAATTNIGTTHSLTVGGAQTVEIGASHSLSVAGNQDVTVGGNESVDIAKNQATSIGGALTITVAKAIGVTGSDALSLSLAKDVTLSGDAKITQTAAKEFSVAGDKIVLKAEQEISLKVGSASITMKKNGDITIKGNKVTISGDGDVKVKGSKLAGN